MKQIDFLAIGDITTDAFIRLKEASVHCDINRQNCEICMPFAEKIPFESVYVVPAVGNCSNAAVSAARLGLTSALMTNIGDDQNGKDCIASLKKDGVITKFITKNPGKATNYHYVLWYEDERTILVKHEEFKYKFNPPWKNPRWIYLTSLGDSSFSYQEEIATWLEKNPEIKVAFQPGTFQINLGVEKLNRIYKRTEVFFCNVEEARRILKNDTTNVRELMSGIHNLGPKIVVITDGPKGAHAFDGKETWFMPTYPDPKPPYERTGAGDSFASAFTVALALGKSVPEALSWGPINSMSVVQYVGAQKGLLTREQLEDHLKNAPAEYKPSKVE